MDYVTPSALYEFPSQSIPLSLSHTLANSFVGLRSATLHSRSRASSRLRFFSLHIEQKRDELE